MKPASSQPSQILSNQDFYIPIRFPSQNQVINKLKSRSGKFLYNKFKKELTEQIHTVLIAERVQPMKRVKIQFLWVEPDRRRDWDNITFSQKFILDALVSGGIIEDDRRQVVRGISHSIADWVNKETPGVHVTLEEQDESS